MARTGVKWKRLYNCCLLSCFPCVNAKFTLVLLVLVSYHTVFRLYQFHSWKTEGLFSLVWRNLILNQRFRIKSPLLVLLDFTFFISRVVFFYQKVKWNRKWNMKLFNKCCHLSQVGRKDVGKNELKWDFRLKSAFVTYTFLLIITN